MKGSVKGTNTQEMKNASPLSPENEKQFCRVV